MEKKNNIKIIIYEDDKEVLCENCNSFVLGYCDRNGATATAFYGCGDSVAFALTVLQRKVIDVITADEE